MAPNVFHIGVEEKVSISVFDNAQPVTVKLYLQDFPHRRKTFSQVQGVVNKGEFSFLKTATRTRNSTSVQLMGCANNLICRTLAESKLALVQLQACAKKHQKIRLLENALQESRLFSISFIREQGWSSSESAHLPPMWPVVICGLSLLLVLAFLRGFFSGYSSFPPS